MPTFREMLSRRHRPKDRGSEKKVSTRLGMNLVRGSGSGTQKSDMLNKDVRLEAKATTAFSYSVKLEELHKINREAITTNRIPALSITFIDVYGEPRRGGKWVAIPEYVFKEWMDKL